MLSSMSAYVRFGLVDPKYLNWSTSSGAFPFIHMFGRWSWLDAVDENFASVVADFHSVSSSCFSSLSVSCSSSQLPPSRSMSSANLKLQSGRPPMDINDSGVSISSASSTASSAKQSFFMVAEMRTPIVLSVPGL